MLTVQSLASSAFSTPRLILQLSQLLIGLKLLLDDGYFSCCLHCRISFSLPPLFLFCISWAFEIFFFISKLPKASTIHLPLSSPHPSISSFFILSYLSHYLIPPCWFHSPLLVFSRTSSQIPCLCLPLCRLPPCPDSIQATVASLMLRICGWQPLACTVTTWSYCTWGRHTHPRAHTRTCHLMCMQACWNMHPSFCQNKIHSAFFCSPSFLSPHRYLTLTEHFTSLAAPPQHIYEFNPFTTPPHTHTPTSHPPTHGLFLPTALCSLLPFFNSLSVLHLRKWSFPFESCFSAAEQCVCA